jgi:hypothetical protein
MSMCLLVGQSSVLDTAEIRLSISLFSSVHSSSRCSLVWSLCPQGHFGESIILNLCRYVLMLPWPVIIVVRVYVCMYVCIFYLN